MIANPWLKRRFPAVPTHERKTRKEVEYNSGSVEASSRDSLVGLKVSEVGVTLQSRKTSDKTRVKGILTETPTSVVSMDERHVERTRKR